MPIDIWIKGYLAMGTIPRVQSCITATGTICGVHAGRRRVERIGDARTERLPMALKACAQN